jgi:hypothetical protein
MFKLIKEIKSKQGVLHFKRWELFTSKRFNFSIYLHGIYKADEDPHLHNHPWNIATLILWGSYIEELDFDDLIVDWHESQSIFGTTLNIWKYLKISREEYLDRILIPKNIIRKRGWLNFAYRPRKHYHKIQKLLSKKVYSLAFVWGKKSDWGYNVDGKEIHHLEYRKQKHDTK